MKSPCCHYWLIERAYGDTSRGTCKFYKATKEFINDIPQIPKYGVSYIDPAMHHAALEYKHQHLLPDWTDITPLDLKNRNTSEGRIRNGRVY